MLIKYAKLPLFLFFISVGKLFRFALYWRMISLQIIKIWKIRKLKTKIVSNVIYRQPSLPNSGGKKAIIRCMFNYICQHNLIKNKISNSVRSVGKPIKPITFSNDLFHLHNSFDCVNSCSHTMNHFKYFLLHYQRSNYTHFSRVA